MGLPKEASIMTGKLLELHGKAFFEDPNRGWVWTCNDTDIASFTALIESFPQILYAYVARADCLKKHGIASWQEDAGRAKKLCDITRAVDPPYLYD